MTRMRMIKPSESPALGDGDISRVRVFLDQLRPFIRTGAKSGEFATPANNWDRNRDTSQDHYSLSERLFRADPDDLRYFRFLCKTFSGYSLYHRSDAHGTTLANAEKFTDLGVDKYWTETAFPENDYNDHLRLTFGLPPGLIFQPPMRLGEAGWCKDQRFFSIDQLYYQERLSLLFFSGLIQYLEHKIGERGEARILEIGGGYGALAYALKSYFPRASYTIVDLPESLVFSGTYLTLLRPDLRISVGPQAEPFGYRLVPNMFAQALNERFDLIINTLSMSEMSEGQVAEYCRLIKENWIPNAGFFYEQNIDNTPVGLINAEPIIERILERQFVMDRVPFGLRRGKPTIWRSPGNHEELSPVGYDSFERTLVLRLNDYSFVRTGCEYSAELHGRPVGRGMSLEAALAHVA